MAGLFRRLRKSRNQCLAEEVDRSTRWLQSTVITAHGTDAIVPETVDACVVVLRAWSAYMTRWAEEG